VGGSDGLGYFFHGRFKTAQLTGGASLENVTGVVPTPSGDFWVHTLDGVYLLPASEVKASEANPAYGMHFRKFDTLDGLPGAPALQIPLPSAVRGSDGRIWFATSNGVVWVDPAQLISNRLAPPISIDSIQADGKIHRPRDGLVLPPNTRNIKLRFAALGLTIPERIQVRVRMSGVDHGWVDVGHSREAGYTNLGPGRYRLQVIAANEDGVWNSVGTSVDFRIAPTFFQTSWFVALCTVIAALLAWLGFIYRLRYERRLVANRLAATHAERERIARELHDTLLQGFQGLLMRVQVWVGDRDLSAARRLEMDRAIDQTQDLLSQGRDRILALRSSANEPRKLASELRDFCAGFATTHPTRIEVLDAEPSVMLPNTMANEVLAIAHEAISNAFLHAKATMIEVELKRVAGAVHLTVRDDGCGIGAEIVHAGGRAGHWGLIGMHERARRMGTALSISSDSTKGTRVLLMVPGTTRRRHRIRIWQRGTRH
jgi:signal transduction histidine kinase